MSEHSIEANLDNPHELSWSEASAMVEARLEYMEPEAIQILKALRVNECRDTFEAMVEFFGTIDLIADELAFVSAIRVIDRIYEAFEKIDTDHDSLVSKKELEEYSRDASDEDKESFDGVIKHHNTLRRVCRHDSFDGISRRDLIKAGNIFRGLKYTQENFDLISEKKKNKSDKLTPYSIKTYLEKNKTKLSLREKSGLKQLILLLHQVTKSDSIHSGLTKEELEHLEADEILRSRSNKKKSG